MRQLLGIALILVIGLVVSHRWFGKLKGWGASRFFYLTGEEFLLLGVLLGPQAGSLIDQDTLVGLEPFIGLGLGYVGLIFGMQFRRHDLAQVPLRYFAASALQNLVVAGVLAAALFWAAGAWFPTVASPPLILAAVATAVGTSTSFLFLVDQRTQLRRSELFRFMRFSSVFDDLFGVLLFGLAMCLMRPQGLLGGGLVGLQWLLVSILVGAAGGALLLWAARMGLDDREELLMLLGLVLFTGGLATYLKLSPVFTNLIAGVLFCNLDRRAARYHSLLLRVEKPLYLFLLVLAGAMWRPQLGGLGVLLVVYAGGRTAGKVLGGVVAAVALTGARPRGGLGLGQSAQSEMAVAMAINLLLIHQSPGTGLLVSTVFIAIVIHDLFSSAYFARNYRRG